ncbi:hypothetical protein PMIN04_009802 [Paraphaeosphaeria minitans]
MFTFHLLASFLALTTASFTPDALFATLLKRQAPGSPGFACHDNCGTAITISKAGGDYCTDDVFLYDYANCLQCAGPDNADIWKYYGGSLTTAAGKCSGLETQPKSGTQEDVGDAKHPGDASSAVSTAAPSETAEPVTEPASTMTLVEPVTVPAESTATAGESVVSSAVSLVSSAPTDVTLSTVSGTPNATSNGTTVETTPTVSAPSEFPGAAETVQVRNVAALIGAVAAVGAFY